jgi:hypothetical protein
VMLRPPVCVSATQFPGEATASAPSHHPAIPVPIAPSAIAQILLVPRSEQPVIRQRWHYFYRQAIAGDLEMRQHRQIRAPFPAR